MGDNFRALEFYLEHQPEWEREAYRRFCDRLANKKQSNSGERQDDPTDKTSGDQVMGKD